MMSFASLLSLTRRRSFQICLDRLHMRDLVVRSGVNHNVSLAPPSCVPSLGLRGLWASGLSARFVDNCHVETKMSWSLRWSSTWSEQSRDRRAGEFIYMKKINSIEEASGVAFKHLDDLDSKQLSSFWTRISQLLTGPRSQRDQRARDDISAAQYRQIMKELVQILGKTMDNMREFDQRHLAQTALALAKIVREVENATKGQTQQPPAWKILRNILVRQKLQRKEVLFQSIASHALPLLHKFDARCLSNLAYANAIVGTVPRLKDGRTLFDHVAERSIPLLKSFEPQGLSNMVWAYEKIGASNPALFEEACNPALFEEVAKEIVARDQLGTFKPQELSNILLAYSKSGVQSPSLFTKVENHIVGLNDLGGFKPQELSNTMWAFAKAGGSNSRLFQKIARYIIGLNDLNIFKSQELSNIVWSFAKAGESNPRLFQKIADRIIESTDLNSFNLQALSNTVWAFAKAGEPHPQLFHRVADHILSLDDLRSFSSKDVSQILWAYSNVGIVHTALFKKVNDHATVPPYIYN